jgi:hypothetical protein
MRRRRAAGRADIASDGEPGGWADSHTSLGGRPASSHRKPCVPQSRVSTPSHGVRCAGRPQPSTPHFASSGLPVGGISGDPKNSARTADSSPPATDPVPQTRPPPAQACRSHQILHHPKHASLTQLHAQILHVQMRVDLLRGLHRTVSDQLADDLKRHPRPPAQRRIRMPEPVPREVKPDRAAPRGTRSRSGSPR